MNKDEIYSLFNNVTIWSRGSERAPHKPLLLLFALGKCIRGETRLIPYAEVDEYLRKLLVEFGPVRKSYHTEYPFWRLKNDGIWELSSYDLSTRKSNTDPLRSELLTKNILGGFPLGIYNLLINDKILCKTLADMILENNFPSSIHSDILDAVGIDDNEICYQQTKRDPLFRERILEIYEYRCAICGSDLRLGTINIGLEAAHIKWHQAGGPDIATNGLCLCILHHKLFDRGAYTIGENHKILVSQKVNGNGFLADQIICLHNHDIRKPIKIEYLPLQKYLIWHNEQVFKSPSR